MKKAILISGIIWGILLALAATVILFFALGTAMTSSSVVHQFADTQHVTVAEAEKLLKDAQLVLIVTGAILVVATIFSFVLAGLRNSTMPKGLGITFGIIGIVLGAELPGIFFIIDSARSR